MPSIFPLSPSQLSVFLLNPMHVNWCSPNTHGHTHTYTFTVLCTARITLCLSAGLFRSSYSRLINTATSRVSLSLSVLSLSRFPLRTVFPCTLPSLEGAVRSVPPQHQCSGASRFRLCNFPQGRPLQFSVIRVMWCSVEQRINKSDWSWSVWSATRWGFEAHPPPRCENPSISVNLERLSLSSQSWRAQCQLCRQHCEWKCPPGLIHMTLMGLLKLSHEGVSLSHIRTLNPPP